MVTEAELQWALTYDGYARMARSPETLYELLRPAMAEHAATNRIPEWCGVDFLRAWAFYRQREHHHVGYGPIAEDFYDVVEAIRRHPAAKKRDLPPPRPASLPEDWRAHLRETLAAPYWSELMDFVARERETHEVFPPEEQTFRAFELTPYDDVRVVILGQDPYPTAGDADGLAFSVSNPAAETPDSLRNIFSELAADVGAPTPTRNSLEGWARQGVLLLNTALTLRAGDHADHAVHRRWRWKRQGWHTFTDAVISAISAKEQPVVFILWGADARKKSKLVDTRRHCVIEQVHPSPKSSYKGFVGSKPFSQADQFLRDEVVARSIGRKQPKPRRKSWRETRRCWCDSKSVLRWAPRDLARDGALGVVTEVSLISAASADWCREGRPGTACSMPFHRLASGARAALTASAASFWAARTSTVGRSVVRLRRPTLGTVGNAPYAANVRAV